MLTGKLIDTLLTNHFRWCDEACAVGTCPNDSCKCFTVRVMVTKPTTSVSNMNVDKVCLGTGEYAGIDVFDQW